MVLGQLTKYKGQQLCHTHERETTMPGQVGYYRHGERLGAQRRPETDMDAAQDSQIVALIEPNKKNL